MSNPGAWALLMALVWAGFQVNAQPSVRTPSQSQTQVVNAGSPQGAAKAPAVDEFKDFDAELVDAAPKPAAPKTPLFRLEPVFGMTASTLEGANHISGASVQPLIGYQGGVSAVVGRSNLKFETGLLYAERGLQYVSSFDTSSKFTIQARYLEVPALLRYSFQEGAHSNFFLRGGLVMAMLQDARGSFDGNRAYFDNVYLNTSSISTTPSTMDVKGSLTDQDYRGQVGLGVAFRVNKGASWVIEADYERSINNVAKGALSSDSSYTSTLGFLTGISLEL